MSNSSQFQPAGRKALREIERAGANSVSAKTVKDLKPINSSWENARRLISEAFPRLDYEQREMLLKKHYNRGYWRRKLGVS